MVLHKLNQQINHNHIVRKD